MHASGIRVSQELKQRLAEFENDPSSLFFTIDIENDSFLPKLSGSKLGSSEENFQQVAKILAPRQPTFIVMKETPEKYLLIFYMPEDSMVREKMLYAASLGGVQKAIGSKLTSEYNISTQTECTYAEYQRSRKGEGSDELLTFSERIKKDMIMSEHKEAVSGGTSAGAAMGDLSITVEPATAEAFGQFSQRNSSTLVLSITESESLHLAEAPVTSTTTVESLQRFLPANAPRYLLHLFNYEVEGKAASAVVLVYYCPDNARPKEKMSYSTFKARVVKAAVANGVEIAKQVEISSPSELTTSEVLEHVSPSKAGQTSTTSAGVTRQAFKKPTAPGGKRFIGSGFKSTSTTQAP